MKFTVIICCNLMTETLERIMKLKKPSFIMIEYVSHQVVNSGSSKSQRVSHIDYHP